MKAATASKASCDRVLAISIHAAREGGDEVVSAVHYQFFISIHAAREGGDVNVFHSFPLVTVFQSTPPVKAATMQSADSRFPQPLFQSTPPVKAATLCSKPSFTVRYISIHAAREGGDPAGKPTCRPLSAFQSTPPVKAATTASPVSIGDVTSFQSTPPVKAATRRGLN